MEMRERNEFVALGYRSLYDYVVKALGMSEAQGCYFSQIARKAVEIPLLKAAVVQGKLTISQARRIVPVLTKENARDWVAKASTLSQKDLEREVSAANPNATIKERLRPIAINRSELKVGLDNETEYKLKRAQDLLSQKLRRAVSLEQTIAHLADHYLERNDPVRKAERARKRAERIARSSSSRTSRQNREPRVANRDEHARQRPPENAETKVRQTLSASLRHAVHLRDGGQCVQRYPDGSRCPQRRWLDIHHVVPVRQGGKNTLDNLATLCRAHHSGEHAGTGALTSTRRTSEPARRSPRTHPS